MEEKRLNRFTTKIGPREFTITGHKSHRHMQQVSDRINDDLDKLTDKAPHLGLEERALLLSINTASDLLDIEENTKDAAKIEKNAHREINNLQQRLLELETLVEEVSQNRDDIRDQVNHLLKENRDLIKENSQVVQQLSSTTHQLELVKNQQAVTSVEEVEQPKAGKSTTKAETKIDAQAATDEQQPGKSRTYPPVNNKLQFSESSRRLSGLSKTPRR